MSNKTTSTARIVSVILGRVFITAKARALLTPNEYNTALRRHANADWGDVHPSDAEANIEATYNGLQIMSAYGKGKRRFWIITDGDQTETVVMLPVDYAGRIRRFRLTSYDASGNVAYVQ